MLFTYNIKKELQINTNENTKLISDKINQKRSEIPAVTHVDYSARVQSVKENSNKKLYDLIDPFIRKLIALF